MKDTIKILFVIFIAIFLTSTFWLHIQKAKGFQRRSDVYDPLKQIFSELQKTANEKNIELLAKKINLLKERWDAFLEGGKTPEQFQYELMK